MSGRTTELDWHFRFRSPRRRLTQGATELDSRNIRPRQPLRLRWWSTRTCTPGSPSRRAPGCSCEPTWVVSESTRAEGSRAAARRDPALVLHPVRSSTRRRRPPPWTGRRPDRRRGPGRTTRGRRRLLPECRADLGPHAWKRRRLHHDRSAQDGGRFRSVTAQLGRPGRRIRGSSQATITSTSALVSTTTRARYLCR
jgi:hypothetical protein